MVERFLVRVALGDHHSQEDILESREVEHAGVLHVGQVRFPDCRVIERNVPGNKKAGGEEYRKDDALMSPISQMCRS